MARELPLGDLLEVVIDHRGKTPKKMGGTDFTAVGVPVVSAIHVKDGRVEWGQRERYVPYEMYERWMPERLRKGDVLLTSEAPLGEVAQVPSDDDLVLSQRLFALRGREGVLDSSYLRYFLETPEGRNRIQARASGTTVIGIRQAELVKILIPVPSIDEQHRIAGVLGAIDDLIETNRQQVNRLLLAARTRYRRFSPVSEPLSFGDVASVGGGGTPSTNEPAYWNGAIAWATPSDLTALPSPYLFRTARSITDAGLDACSSPLYPAGSILMTSRATIGAFAVAQVPTAVNQGFIVVTPETDADRTFLLLEMMDRVSDFIQHANGSTFLELSRGRFRQLPVDWPSEGDLAKLDTEVGPLIAAGAELQREVTDLTRLRDELLPLLMSGKVRARDVA